MSLPDPSPRRSAADILALGFGTSIAMWTAGYFCRLLGGPAFPTPLLLALLLTGLLAGGYLAGRCTQRGVAGGARTGLLAGAINLLLVASLITGQTPRDIRLAALLWIPGTLAVSAALGALGAAAGRARRPAAAGEPNWSGWLAGAAAGATAVLLAAGGLVTAFDAGLAVPDWPNTEGFNMFLYPLARMTGGVYLEHSHRLLGSLVGLTTLTLAVHIHRSPAGRRLKALAWLALAGVIVQGILGGLRVTGTFTLSTDPQATRPSVVLAIVHGVFGQLVFAALAAVAAGRSRRFQQARPPARHASAGTDRVLGIALLVLLVVQLALGALVRHFTWALHTLPYGLAAPPDHLVEIGGRALSVHITVAVLVALAAVGAGARAWGLYEHHPPLPRLGLVLLALTGLQLALGVAALIVTGDDAPSRPPRALDAAITTAHQVVGAALLAAAVLLVLWNRRLLAPAPAREPARADEGVQPAAARYDV